MISNPALFQTDVPCVKCIDRHIFPVFFDVFPLIGVTGRWVPGPCGYFFLSAGFKICKKTDQQKSQMLIPCLQVYMASPTYDKLICMEVWGLKALWAQCLISIEVNFDNCKLTSENYCSQHHKIHYDTHTHGWEVWIKYYVMPQWSPHHLAVWFHE